MNPKDINLLESGGKIMPLDEREKEALQERYKEHRRSIWFGKHSLKFKKKKKQREVDSSTSHDEEEIKRKISPEPPTKSGEIENVTSGKASRQRDLPIADYEEQNKVVMLKRSKEKKSMSEAPMERSDIPKIGTKVMPSVSDRTTLYEPEATRKEKLSSDITSKTKLGDKTTMLEQKETQANSSASGMRFAHNSTLTSKTKLNVAELPTKLEATAKQSSPLEKILKEKIKSQRQEIWSGASSQKKRRPKLKKQSSKKSVENLSLISEQNSQDAENGLTLGVVFIGIISVVAAIALGVLLGYLLA